MGAEDVLRFWPVVLGFVRMVEMRGVKFLIDLLHPAHAHFFRAIIAEMEPRGHEFLLLSRKKDVLTDLLDSWQLDHVCVSHQRSGRLAMVRELGVRVHAIRRHVRSFAPDLMLGLMGPAISLARPLTGVPAAVFYDNETTARLNALAARLADAWISPRGYLLDHGAKHLRYDGYHETTYLHPRRFSPDAERVRALGIDPERPYSVVRFVGWESIHDGGESGFSRNGKRALIETLARLGPVYVSSEKPLPEDLAAHRLHAPAGEIHHVLAFARLFVGESSTMASEAACLGTPAAFVARTGRGVNDEQRDRYGLVATFHGGGEREALAWVEWAVSDPDLTARAAEGHARMLADTVDVTAYIADLLERRFA